MNDEFLESFFAGCDESTMMELMSIFESGDSAKLDEYMQMIPDEKTRKQLLEGYEKLRQFKQTNSDES